MTSSSVVDYRFATDVSHARWWGSDRTAIFVANKNNVVRRELSSGVECVVPVWTSERSPLAVTRSGRIVYLGVDATVRSVKFDPSKKKKKLNERLVTNGVSDVTCLCASPSSESVYIGNASHLYVTSLETAAGADSDLKTVWDGNVRSCSCDEAGRLTICSEDCVIALDAEGKETQRLIVDTPLFAAAIGPAEFVYWRTSGDDLDMCLCRYRDSREDRLLSANRSDTSTNFSLDRLSDRISWIEKRHVRYLITDLGRVTDVQQLTQTRCRDLCWAPGSGILFFRQDSGRLSGVGFEGQSVTLPQVSASNLTFDVQNSSLLYTKPATHGLIYRRRCTMVGFEKGCREEALKVGIHIRQMVIDGATGFLYANDAATGVRLHRIDLAGEFGAQPPQMLWEREDASKCTSLCCAGNSSDVFLGTDCTESPFLWRVTLSGSLIHPVRVSLPEGSPPSAAVACAGPFLFVAIGSDVLKASTLTPTTEFVRVYRHACPLRGIGAVADPGRVAFSSDEGLYFTAMPFPTPESALVISEISPVSAHLSWKTVPEARWYTIELRERFSDRAAIVRRQIAENEYDLYGLKADTGYDVQILHTVDGVNDVDDPSQRSKFTTLCGYRRREMERACSAFRRSGSKADHVFDFADVEESVVEDAQKFVRAHAKTGDRLRVRFYGRGRMLKSEVQIVERGDSIELGTENLNVYLPFDPNGGHGQKVRVQAHDTGESSQVLYNKEDDSITVESGSHYVIGDVFYMHGRRVELARGSLILMFQNVVPAVYPHASPAGVSVSGGVTVDSASARALYQVSNKEKSAGVHTASSRSCMVTKPDGSRQEISRITNVCDTANGRGVFGVSLLTNASGTPVVVPALACSATRTSFLDGSGAVLGTVTSEGFAFDNDTGGVYFGANKNFRLQFVPSNGSTAAKLAIQSLVSGMYVTKTEYSKS